MFGFETMVRSNPGLAIYHWPDATSAQAQGLTDEVRESVKDGMQRYLAMARDEEAGKFTREQNRAIIVCGLHLSAQLRQAERPAAGPDANADRPAEGGNTYRFRMTADKERDGNEPILGGKMTLVSNGRGSTQDIGLVGSLEPEFTGDHITLIFHKRFAGLIKVQPLRNGKIVDETSTSDEVIMLHD